MITLKRQLNEHIVTVDGKQIAFDTMREALEFVYNERGLLK